MDSNKVTVMLPNARRQIVRVNPNKTVLEILEEACQKHGLSSNDYDLKHHNRILDLTQMFRFAGLPNNCLLEMVEATQKRAESDVVLCFQLEDGTRPQATFNPSQTLLEALKELSPDSTASGKNPVVIYMRKEIYGDSLASTTLRSLGITGGRAMLRVVDKNPEELKTQANVYVPPTKDVDTPIDKPQAKRPTKKTEGTKPANEFVTAIKQMKQESVKKEPAEIDTKMDVDQEEEEMEADTQPKKYEWGSAGNTLTGRKVGPESAEDNSEMFAEIDEKDMEEVEAQICILGERNAVLFSLNEAQRVPDDLPDAFFELTVQDLQYLLRDLKRQTEEHNDAPLLTEKLRDLENSKRVLNKIGQYKKSVIRVQFPNRLVLQGTFSPIETIETVQEFVRNYIQDSNLKFYLFTIPPKTIIPTDKTLVEADCVPTAILHFGTDENVSGDILKAEYLEKLTTPDGAVLAASRSRGLTSIKKKQTDPQQERNQPGPSTGAIPKQPKAERFKESSAAHKPSGVVPKWFKPTGK